MPLTFHHGVLPNSLDIVAEVNPDAYSVALGLFVKTGSRDETAPINGVSHFLEHMMFKGSAKYTWEDVNRIFDEMGARYNAFTSQEMTAYYANVLPEFTQKAMEHLSHLLRPAPALCGFRHRKEGHPRRDRHVPGRSGASVVRAADGSAFWAASLVAQRAGVGAIGAESEAAGNGRLFFPALWAGEHGAGGDGETGFRANRGMGQSIHGIVDDGGGQAGAAAAADCRRARFHGRRQAQSPIHHGPDARPQRQDERRFAARVLSDVIGDSDGSRLYWALVDNAIAEEAEFGFYPHDGCGSYYLGLTTEPDRTRKALDIALAELQKAKQDLNDEEVDRARNKIASSIVLQGEVPLGRMRAIGGQWVYNEEYRSLEQDMATLMAVTTDSLRKVMEEFPFDPMTVLTLGPEKREL